MAKSKQQRLVEDRLWELIEPLIPRVQRFVDRVGGRRSTIGPRRKGSCSCSTWLPLTGPAGGAGLREWQDAGVRSRLHQLVLDELSEAQLLDWSRAASRFKRLGLRYDRTERTTVPLLTLACA
ncbi:MULTISPECIES: hypothetical protein [unclassified Pseudonocardia]|uniref:hypothetical protein n=1 Tax=unclassified Pseudonocardia TaxID=2619320 RepID=UPI000967873E|nr:MULTISPECIES: hypothetical protein [unclassified Pseudonocardia]MBN9100700.1 hypothetical protein [Pseudonocardia sp.]OJY47732.1 MAG: hypothetical protein BGP03_34020 [Pseudonocardia sp. 73-21]